MRSVYAACDLGFLLILSLILVGCPSSKITMEDRKSGKPPTPPPKKKDWLLGSEIVERLQMPSAFYDK